jgi:hypothetical protein
MWLSYVASAVVLHVIEYYGVGKLEGLNRLFREVNISFIVEWV